MMKGDKNDEARRKSRFIQGINSPKNSNTQSLRPGNRKAQVAVKT